MSTFEIIDLKISGETKRLYRPEVYRKGTIIPRRFIRCKNRKLQYLFKWGADVAVCGREIYALSDGAVFVIGRTMIAGRNGTPNRHARPVIQRVNVYGAECMVRVEG